MKREIIRLPLQSFCFGVKNAINETNRILNNPHTKKPIYMLGEIVHNKYVSAYFENKGIIVLKEGTRREMINSINKGTIIFTAHGVSSDVINIAKSKNLPFFNTACPFVKNSVKLLEKYLGLGYEIIYIGSKKHPESETALSFGKHIHLIENLSDVQNLNLQSDKIIVTNQTTMSIYDIYDITNSLQEKYPHLLFMEKVCSATKERQEMIFEVVKKHENNPNTAFIVVGDINSHNSKKLVETIKKYNQNVYFIETIEELNEKELDNFKTIYLASGTSTPPVIIDEIYNALINEKTSFKSQLQLEDYVK